MRILQLLDSGQFPPGLWQAFMGLESHEEDFKKMGGRKWEDICLMSKAAKEYAQSRKDDDFVVGIMCRVS